LGVDIDSGSLSEAIKQDPNLTFLHAALEDALIVPPDGGVDYVVLSGVLDQVYDVYTALIRLNRMCAAHTRVVIVTYSRLWQPLLRLAEQLNLKSNVPAQNWIPTSEIRNLSEQAGLEVIKIQSGVLIPVRIPLMSRWINRWLAPLPILRHLNMVHLTVLRKAPIPGGKPKVSILVPARNESGNIAPLLDRLPLTSVDQEVVFVEGNSTDDTWCTIVEECEKRRSEGYPSTLAYLKQPGVGKGDAVRAGFAAASGDIFIILDADLSVPPEELPRFVESLNGGTGEFINGSRLVYSMEDSAMRFLNLLGNRFFGSLFSFLLGQPVRDTLCGTKALSRANYHRIVENRSRFGDFDPFGDFDLLFGAASLNLKIRDQPVHYKARTYGSTNISRYRHGLLLLRMSWFAARRIRFM
jgi:hypothetical protein